MIFIKAERIDIDDLPEKAEPILFYIYGAYFYVQSGIVENELRVLRHWKIIGHSEACCNTIDYKQGTSIPQELGDYLVAHQNDNQTTDETKQTEDQTDI